VSHELRTPLTAVVGLAAELHQNLSLFDAAEIEEFVTTIAGQSKEVAHIVEDLLVIARADIENLVVANRRFDALEETRSVLSTIVGDPAWEIAGDRIEVMADPARFRQIVRNLATNAVRHGGPTVRARVRRGPSGAVVEIMDDGDGIAEGDRDRVFEAYGRAEGRSIHTASVGLGLTVSRRLAERMGGSLAYAHEDGWSTFRLTLPAAD
jgi:signal transduction histidine kinase